jgi:hypothetical protein
VLNVGVFLWVFVFAISLCCNGYNFFYRTRVQFFHKSLDFQCLNFDVFVIAQLAREVWTDA